MPAPAPPALVIRLVAVVSGHVQGVGYRYFVRGLALAAGIAGSATNLSDGRVEVVVEGDEDAVRSLVAALDGPEAPGRVSAVDLRDDVVRGVQNFTVA